MESELSFDESLERFDLLRRHLFENDDTWYNMRVEENRIICGNRNEKRPSPAPQDPKRRYFNCFYYSFRQRDNEFYQAFLNDVAQKEWAERETLNRYEQEEFYGICRYAGNVLGVPEWSCLYCTSLPPFEAEVFGRRMIISEFFQMHLEALTVLEALHRRTILFVEEPLARKTVEGGEVHDWVEARRCQVEREQQEERGLEVKERQHDLAYHIWKRKQEYQVFLFEQSEQEERMDVERLQRFHAGILAQVYSKELKEARYHQLWYEKRQRLLSADLSRTIIGNEVTARAAIMLLQHDQFRALQAEEVKSFLWTKRNIMLNELVDRERGGGGCVYAYM